MLQYVFLCEHLPLILHQIFQQPVLLPRQGNLLPFYKRPLSVRVQDKLPRAHRPLLILPALSPQHSLDSFQQHFHGKRLDHIIIRADIESGKHIPLLISGCQENGRDFTIGCRLHLSAPLKLRPAFALQFLIQTDAVSIREPDVNQEQSLSLPHQRQRILSCTRTDSGIPCVFQAHVQRLIQKPVILDNSDCRNISFRLCILLPFLIRRSFSICQTFLHLFFRNFNTICFSSAILRKSPATQAALSFGGRPPVVIIFQKMPKDIRLFSLLLLISRPADSLSLLQILFLIIMGEK